MSSESVPEGEPAVYLPKVTDEIYEQFVGEALLDDDAEWTQAAADLACLFKAQAIAWAESRAAQPPSAWLSVEDVMPEEYVDVLIAGEYPNGIPFVEESHLTRHGHFAVRKLDKVTHWMPLPEPPRASQTKCEGRE